MLIIHSADKDLEYRNEYDMLLDVYFKGVPFTGIIQDELERIEYLNGVIHGEYKVWFNSGGLREISFYELGLGLKTTVFFENGNTNKEYIWVPESGKYDCKVWNIEGKLIRENDCWYYVGGQIKEIREVLSTDHSIQKRFSKSGEWMYAVTNKRDESGRFERETQYNEPVMWANYHPCLIEENPELADGDDKNQTLFIWLWFWKVFDEDGKKYLEIVADLLKHPEMEVRRTIANIITIHKLNPYLDDEMLADPGSARLIEELTAYHNKRDPDREAKQLVIKNTDR